MLKKFKKRFVFLMLPISLLHVVNASAETKKLPSLDQIKKICEKGNARACFYLAYSYEAGKIGGKVNFPLSEIYYKKTCDLNDYKACMNLANNYMSKKFITKNIIGTAFKYYKKSCGGKIESACSYYGSLNNRIANGQKEAAWAYDNACNLGSAAGCYEAGKIYNVGRGSINRQGGGVTKNLPKALAYFNKACAGGVAKACK